MRVSLLSIELLVDQVKKRDVRDCVTKFCEQSPTKNFPDRPSYAISPSAIRPS